MWDSGLDPGDLRMNYTENLPCDTNGLVADTTKQHISNSSKLRAQEFGCGASSTKHPCRVFSPEKYIQVWFSQRLEASLNSWLKILWFHYSYDSKQGLWHFPINTSAGNYPPDDSWFPLEDGNKQYTREASTATQLHDHRSLNPEGPGTWGERWLCKRGRQRVGGMARGRLSPKQAIQDRIRIGWFSQRWQSPTCSLETPEAKK